MRLLKAEESIIDEVIELLDRGGVIIYPTETLYGIGVRYDNRDGLKKIFELKSRSKEKTLLLIVNSNHLDLLVSHIPSLAKRFIEKYWPGPLTILLPAKEGLPEEIVKDGKVAVRMPGESFALKLILRSPFPITATSANISDRPASADFETVYEYFKDSPVDMIIDGGKLFGVPSTIIDLAEMPPKIIRKGALEIDLSSY